MHFTNVHNHMVLWWKDFTGNISWKKRAKSVARTAIMIIDHMMNFGVGMVIFSAWRSSLAPAREWNVFWCFTYFNPAQRRETPQEICVVTGGGNVLLLCPPGETFSLSRLGLSISILAVKRLAAITL